MAPAEARRRPLGGARAPRRTVRSRRLVALAVVGAVIGAAGLLALAARGRGDALPAVTAQPEVGTADAAMVLIGSAPRTGVAGETWGYRRLPVDVASAAVGGRALEFGPPTDPTSPDPQLVFERYTDATGWQVFQTPVDQDGKPYRGMLDNPQSARLTPSGGGLLVGRDPRRALDDQVTVLLRDPGARFRALPDPPADALELAAGSDPAEALAGDRGTGAVAAAAYDAPGSRTGAFFAVQGRDVQDAVVHWDGAAWSREPVCLPPDEPAVAPAAGDPCPFAAATTPPASFTIVALAAASPTNAWMLAEPDPATDAGLVLYQRQTGPDGPFWAQRALNAPLFEAKATPAQDVTDLHPLTGTADPLTVTENGVWIDGSLQQSGRPYDFTAYFDPAAGSGKLTGSWCDAPAVTREALCDAPLDASLSTKTGYRSFAWAGPGFGTRVITNALDPGGDDLTNRGTYLAFDGSRFTRRPGAGGNQRRSGAFASVGEGWLQGPAHITGGPRPTRLASWPVALRAPLTGVAGQPGAPPGSLFSQALAVGQEGAVARYQPGAGWSREFLLTSSGTVSKPTLRAVAWPQPDRAYAVGDLGAMWLWRQDTGLWEKDPAAPIGFEGNLMGVAFDPVDPERGYAVGKGGVLLHYDKTWSQDALPAGLEGANLTSVAFAGRQALVAAGGALLVNDGSGWRIDQGVTQLLAPIASAGPQLFAVAGLPDGGAVAAGRDFVIERDSPSAPWRFADQPLPDSTVVALGAFRDGGRVRAVASLAPRLPYPPPDELPEPDPNVPPPIVPPFALPGDGYVVRETAEGWRDEQRTAFSGSGTDRPVKSDPVLAFDLDAGGEGWGVGGWSGETDSAGRGNSNRSGAGRGDRQRVETGAVQRYAPGGAPAAPTAVTASPVPLETAPVRFAIAGHAACEQPCADLSQQGLAPDRTLSATLDDVAVEHARPNGPRMLLYTGGRLAATGSPEPQREVDRFASLLAARGDLAVYPATSSGDSSGDSAGPFRTAFAAFPAPFGAGGQAAGVSTGAVPAGVAPGPGARTHYAFDSAGPSGTVRVVVIDNSSGSLAASDAHQNPAEPQRPWLVNVLQDARARGLPAIVMGSRDLNPRFSPRLNVASDGDDVAKLLVDGGASAYFFERPEENRSYPIPAGAAQTIPSFGTGTLGYRSPLSNVVNRDRPDAVFGDTGYLLAEIDASRRDPATNRAPVSVRLIPVVDDVSLQAVDGTLLRRSRVALFQGLGRRPVSGDRWGRTGGSDPEPPGGSPYVSFPPDQCFQSSCGTRVAPEYRFTSSDPDLGDFVKVDPASTNLRKPLLDAGDKVVTDNSSGLFCAFNAGTTTVTIQAGGLAFSQKVTILDGSVQRPCGTRPKSPARFRQPTQQQPDTPPPPPGPAPQSSPPPSVAPPPPPPPPTVPASIPVVAAVAAAVPRPPAVKPAVPKPPPSPPILPVIPPVPIAPNSLNGLPPATPPPPPPTIARPIPPGGVVAARVAQVEEKREEELAPELEHAFGRYHPDEHAPVPPYVLGLVLIAALAGASIHLRSRDARRRRHRGRPTPRPAWATAERSQHRRPPTSRRHPYR